MGAGAVSCPPSHSPTSALLGFPSSSASQYCILQLLPALARYLHIAAAADGNHAQLSHLQQEMGVCEEVVRKCRGR